MSAASALPPAREGCRRLGTKIQGVRPACRSTVRNHGALSSDASPPLSTMVIVSALKVLDDILGRMQAHQFKKRPMLRELRLAHSLPDEPRVSGDGNSMHG